MPRVKKLKTLNQKGLEVVLFQLLLTNLKLSGRRGRIRMHNAMLIHAWKIFVFHAFSMHYFSNSHLV